MLPCVAFAPAGSLVTFVPAADESEGCGEQADRIPGRGVETHRQNASTSPSDSAQRDSTVTTLAGHPWRTGRIAPVGLHPAQERAVFLAWFREYAGSGKRTHEIRGGRPFISNRHPPAHELMGKK
jgi:hypothetical protein